MQAAPEARRTKVAPLLAAGMTIRSISAQTGIPLGAVHRAKRRIEKEVARGAGQKAAAVPLEPPPSYLVQQNIDGVRQDVRRLSIAVYERAVGATIGRGLLDHGDRDKPWTVTNAFAPSVSSLFRRLFGNH